MKLYRPLFCALFYLGLLSASEVSQKESDLLWLGSVTGEITPLAEEIYLSPGVGEIQFLKEEGSVVKLRESWAVFNRESILNKEKSLSLTERGVRFQLRDIDEKKEKEKEELDTAFIELEEETLKLKELQNSDIGDAYKGKIQDALKEIGEKREKMQEAFNLKFSEDKMNLEKEKLLFNLESQKRELEDFRESSYLKADVAGTLSYLIPEAKFDPYDPTKATTNNTDTLAMIRDDSSVLVIVPESSFERPLRRDQNYLARVTSESGMKFSASLRDTFTSVEGKKFQKFYRFQIETADLMTARNCIGQSAILNVSVEFKEKHTIVKKEEILKHDPAMVQKSGWELATMRLFPNMKVVSVGKGAIALKPLN